MITKFENLDEEIQVLAKVYYSTAVMVGNALTKIYSLEDIDNEKFNKAYRGLYTLPRLLNLAKNAEDEESKKFYQDFLDDKEKLYYCQGMFMDARRNYMKTVVFCDDKFSYVIPPLLLKQVDELNVQIPENVKQLVVATVNAKEEVEKTAYNIRLTKIIEDVFTR